MTIPNKVTKALFAIEGIIIGISAFTNYLHNVGRNYFFSILCIAMAILIALVIERKIEGRKVLILVTLVAGLLLSQLLAFCIVWIVCAIQMILSILWGILSIIGRMIGMFF